MAKSKYPNGGIKLTIVHVSGLEQQRRWSLVLLDSLKQLNIDLDIKPMIWPDMVGLTRSPETTPDFFAVYQTANYGDPDNIAFARLPLLPQRQLAEPGLLQPEGGRPDHARPRRDRRGKAQGDLKEFQQVVVDDAPDIFGVLENRKLALRAEVQNFRFTPVASNAIELFPLSLR